MSFTKPESPHLYVLADCNNFYASCERVFNPAFAKRPLVVLSNNDGCIVARSKEAKGLGIPMGAPLFEWKQVIRQHQVIVRSSNYTLYGDMSRRVMESLARFSPEIEIYSIDEAFLSFPKETSYDELVKMRNQVYQWTGIPISLGIAPTKTLAKVANELAKSETGVFSLTEEKKRGEILEKMPVAEIWGIGSRTARKLHAESIWSAGDLMRADDLWIRKHFSVVLLRTVWELRGISCLSIEEISPPKKSIVCSRSFGKPLDQLDDIAEALSAYTARGAEKLRRQKSLTSFLEVFLVTNFHSKTQPYYFNKHTFVLPEPTAHTPTLIGYAKQALSKIYRDGLLYKKTGVLFGGLVPANAYQRDLFTQTSEKHAHLMNFIDQTNQRLGKKALKFAAEGIQQTWKMNADQKSPCYTTRWDDLLTIKI